MVAVETGAAIDKGITALLQHQTPAGYWWYTLEANESIAAEYIFLEHCLGLRTAGVWEGLVARMRAQQLDDGSWPLAHAHAGNLSTTLECYVAMRMAGIPSDDPQLRRAHAFMTVHGGVAAARVFTKVHFAALGLMSWSEPPTMPVEINLLPSWSPVSIYSFSSWARACIVPLTVVMTQKPVWPLGVDGLRAELPTGDPQQQTKRDRRDIWAEFFTWADRIMKFARPVTQLRPTKGMALQRAEEWIRGHIAKTEDIFPALSYAALAMASLGYASTDPTIQKALGALQRFQHSYTKDLPAVPFTNGTSWKYHDGRRTTDDGVNGQLHQQCCISPVWDTPWACCALEAAGLRANHPALTKSGTWLLTQQITDWYGDWHKKNPNGKPGGWAFEFENPYFPDVDDTIQVLLALDGMDLPALGLREARAKALAWCLSMQNDDGGWAAFDKNNSLAIVNKIPFADHGACLDPSSPDITGRMLQLLAAHGYTPRDKVVKRAVKYLQKTQEANGSWFGRWGVNYIYGTWTVLSGLQKMDYPLTSREVVHAVQWLTSVQNDDGGFGESVDSYPDERFVSMPSTASQTAWGLMGLVSAGLGSDEAARRAAQWLIAQQGADGTWDERAYTGTGFPGHFYIRYHGYRHYFPLMALGLYRHMTA